MKQLLQRVFVRSGSLLKRLHSGSLTEQIAALQKVQAHHAKHHELYLAVYECSRKTHQPALCEAAQAALLRMGTPKGLHARLLSADGRERERALHEINVSQVDTVLLQTVLLRLNDWVPQVRKAAWLALQRLESKLDFALLLSVLPTLQALKRGQRADHGAALALIRKSLQRSVQDMDEDQRRRLHAVVRRGASVQARFAFDALLDWVESLPDKPHRDEVRYEVLGIGLASAQADVNRRAVRQIQMLPWPGKRQVLYEQALHTHNASIRLMALRALAQNWDAAAARDRPVTDLPVWLGEALLDVGSAVRYLALMLCGGASPALLSHAQAALQDSVSKPHQRAAALGLMADMALPAGRPLALAALQDPIPGVRCAAYAAAFRLQADEPGVLLLRALHDPSNKVFAVAYRHAQRSGAAITTELLDAHSQEASPQHWLRLLRLATLGNPWDQLIMLLSLPRLHPDEAQARPLMQAWKNQGAHWVLRMSSSCFVQPRPEQLRHIQRLLPQAYTAALFGHQAHQFADMMRMHGLHEKS